MYYNLILEYVELLWISGHHASKIKDGGVD